MKMLYSNYNGVKNKEKIPIKISLAMKRQSNKESGRKSIPLLSKVLYLPISMFDKEIK